jgi:hypothetical protein
MLNRGDKSVVGAHEPSRAAVDRLMFEKRLRGCSKEDDQNKCNSKFEATNCGVVTAQRLID